MSKNRHESPSLRPTMDTYCNLMNEIKIREQAISNWISMPSAPIPMQIVYESCYLQLRMICELIALGCLIVHGDIGITKSKKLREEWHADQIIKRLSEIHPKFFPQPVILTGSNPYKLDAVNTDYLTKEELIDLYTRRAGSRLHRGSITDVARRISPQNVKFERIDRYRAKIVELLKHHWISVHDSSDQIGVQMRLPGQPCSWNFWKHASGAA